MSSGAHETDELAGEVDRMVRGATTLGMQMAQFQAQRATSKARAEAEQQHQEARRLDERMALERDFARATFMPLATNARRAERATVEQVQRGLAYATAWSDQDPQARAAARTLTETLEHRWVSARDLMARAADPNQLQRMGAQELSRAWDTSRQWSPFAPLAREYETQIASHARQRWGDVEGPASVVAAAGSHDVGSASAPAAVPVTDPDVNGSLTVGEARALAEAHAPSFYHRHEVDRLWTTEFKNEADVSEANGPAQATLVADWEHWRSVGALPERSLVEERARALGLEPEVQADARAAEAIWEQQFPLVNPGDMLEYRAAPLEARAAVRRDLHAGAAASALARADALLANVEKASWWEAAQSSDIVRARELADAWARFDSEAGGAVAERIAQEMRDLYGAEVLGQAATDPDALREALDRRGARRVTAGASPLESQSRAQRLLNDVLADSAARSTELLIDQDGAARLARAADWAKGAAPSLHSAWEADRTAGGTAVTEALLALYAEAGIERDREHTEGLRARQELERAERFDAKQPLAATEAERAALYGAERDSRDEAYEAHGDAHRHAGRAAAAESQVEGLHASYDRVTESDLGGDGVTPDAKEARVDSAPAFGRPTSEIPNTQRTRRASSKKRRPYPGPYADRGRSSSRDLGR